MVEDADLIIVPGPRMSIEWAVREDGTIPAREFFHKELVDATRAILMASFRRMATAGEIRQKRKFNREADGFCAFKCDTPEGRMVRFPCFRIGNRWILAHGFFKPAQNRWPDWALNLAQAIRTEHLAYESRKAAMKKRSQSK